MEADMSYEVMAQKIQELPQEAVQKVSLYVDDMIRIYARKDDARKPRKLYAAGIAAKYANPDLIPLEDGAWERDVARRFSLSTENC